MDVDIFSISKTYVIFNRLTFLTPHWNIMVLISRILKLRISNLYIIPLKKMKNKMRKSSFQVSKRNLLNQCKETWFEWPNQTFINLISVLYRKRGKFRYSSKEENVLKKHCLTQTQFNLLGLTDDSCNRKRAYETSIQAKGVQKVFNGYQ